MLDERDEYRDAVLGATDLLTLAEALDVQIHERGLTCPNPDHPQSGASTPCSVSVTDEGVELWCCHRCDIGGTAIEFLLWAGEEGSFSELLDLLADLADKVGPATHEPTQAARRSPQRALGSNPYERPTPEAIERVHKYCRSRGWPPEAMPPHDVVVDHDGRWLWLRIYTSDQKQAWQDRIVVPTKGEPRWRWSYGYSLEMFKYWPENEGGYAMLTDSVLLVEGASDFVTAVVMQQACGVPLTTYAVPGAGYSRADSEMGSGVLRRLVVLGDNDDAGSAMRERFPEARQWYVPEPYHDLADLWAADPSPAAAAAFLREVQRL